jgi:hypothetical protein
METKNIQPIVCETSQTKSDIFMDWPPQSYLNKKPVFSKKSCMILQQVKEDLTGRTILYRGNYEAKLSESCDLALFDITPEAPTSHAQDQSVTVTHNTCDITINFDIPKQEPPLQFQVMLLGFFGLHNRNTTSLHTLFSGHSSMYFPTTTDDQVPPSPKPASFEKEFHLPMCCYDHRKIGRMPGGFRLLSHMSSSSRICTIKATELLVPSICFTRCPLNIIPDRESPLEPRGNILKLPFTIRHKSLGIRDMGLYILIAAQNLRAEPSVISASIEITSKVESSDYWPNSFVSHERLTRNGMYSGSFK